MSISRRRFMQLAAAAAGTAAMLPYSRLLAAKADQLQELYAAAKKERPVTWYVAQVTSEDAERMAALFSETYPGLSVNVVRTTAQVAFQRLSQDLMARARNCDVFSTTDISHVLYLKKEGLLMQYTPLLSERMHESLQNIDPDGYFHTTGAYLNTLYYNQDKLAEGSGPTKWADIMTPALKGQVSVGHPGYSGTVGLWAYEMYKLYGKDFFVQLKENNVQVGRSIIDTITTLMSGERNVGCGPNTLALRAKARGHNITIAYPEEGSVLSLNPSGILANSRNPNASRLFMEWLSGSDAASQYAVSQMSAPRVRGVTPPPGVPGLNDVKVLRSEPEDVVKGIPMLTELWRDVFGV